MKKKILLIVSVFILVLSFTSCGGGKMKNDTVTIDGVYMDDSYNNNNDKKKLLYVYCTISSKDKNLEVSSNLMAELEVGDNSYDSTVYPGAGKYSKSYYYSSIIEEVSMGDSIKLLLTFEVPEAQFSNGKVKMQLSDFDGIFDGITISSDSIVHKKGEKEIAKAADPEGYKKECTNQEPASAEDEAYVKGQINGKYWPFYTNSTSYKIEFSAPNNFVLTTGLGTTTTGTYTVKKAYVTVKNDSNGYETDIPWSNENGEIYLDPAEGYSVY